MRLTSHTTVLDFSGRREAAGGWTNLQAFFDQRKHEPVKFMDENDEQQTGRLIAILGNGLFAVKTKDGRKHEIEPGRLGYYPKWER